MIQDDAGNLIRSSNNSSRDQRVAAKHGLASNPAARAPPRAPPPGASEARTVPLWASAIARTIESPRPAPPELRERARSVRYSRSNTRSRSSAGIPGPSSITANAIRPPGSVSTLHADQPVAWGSLLDRRCARGCGRPCATRSGSAISVPLGTGPSSKRRSAVRLETSQRSVTNGCQRRSVPG